MIRTYALATCYLCVVVLIFGIPFLAMGTVQVVSPMTTLSTYSYSNLVDDDSYWNSKIRYSEVELERPAPILLSKERIAELAKTLHNERRNGWDKVRNSLLFLITSLLFYLIHWRVSKKCSND